MTLSREKKVSIVVPVYGEDQYLPECIESILHQTYQNIEVLLIDDGSPDRCPEICDQYARKDSRIKVVHKENGGLVNARKTGVNLATGDYIGYVDGDDVIAADYYEKMVYLAETQQVDVVICGYKKNTDRQTHCYLNALPARRYDRQAMEQTVFPMMLSMGVFHRFGIFTYVWNKLFKRELIKNSQNQVDARLVVGEDAACIYPAILQADSIYISELCGYQYRQRAGSLLRQQRNGAAMLGRLQICYSFMRQRFYEMDCAFMDLQLTIYVISQMLMLSDCLVDRFPEIPANFPYMSVKPTEKIIIYSAGAFGTHLYTQYIDKECCSIIAVCDPDYEVLDESVISIEEAVKLEYDRWIIASVDRDFINESLAILNRANVTAEKVITIDDTLPAAVNICKRILERNA